jgi:hypothetical protein
LCIVILFACNKSEIGKISNTLTGKWNLVSDSLISGIGPVSTPKIYTGVAGDYFDFRTDNKLYLKEGALLDTFAYTLTSDSTITIHSFGITFNGVLQSSNFKVSANSATLITPFIPNPGAYYRRAVHLAK